MSLRTELRSIVLSLRRLSLVMVDERPEIQRLLLGRYAAVISGNFRYSLALLFAVMVSFGHRAPPGLLAAIWLSTALLYGLRRHALRLGLEVLATPARRVSAIRSWALVLPEASVFVWSALPLLLWPWLSLVQVVCLLFCALGVIGMVSVSYVPALPACLVQLGGNGVLMVAALLLPGESEYFLLAALLAATVVTMMMRVVSLHRTLVRALAAELENADLVRQLEAHREALASENRQLGLSLLAAASAAHRDPLTGLHNRRHVDEVVPRLRAQVESGFEKISVCVLDVDHFKAVNDSHGHPVGDEVLRAVGTLLVGRLREGDELARIGGEEFLLVLRHCDGRGAGRLAETIRERIASRPVATSIGAVPVTISIGAAHWRAGESFEEVFGRADQALYQAKGAGRDQVIVDGIASRGWLGSDSAPMSLH